MAELLFELFSEEIPARMQARAAEDIKKNIITKFEQHNIIYNNINSYVTPRRLVLYVESIDPIIQENIIERKGPKVNAPENAILGFLAKSGKKLEDLEIRNIGKDQVYFDVTKEKSRPVNETLTKILKEIIEEFSWPKSMKWGTYSARWVRPLKNILCLFDKCVLPVNFAHLVANNITFGHRFMAEQQNIVVDSFQDYKQKLLENYVVVDSNKRREIIQNGIREIEQSYKSVLFQDEGLLDEVVGLVEWPVVLLGKIDPSFMDLPKEVLITTMRTHQKYFALLDQKGNLAPYFVIVSNISTEGQGQQIIAGNERVIAARFSDARFFFEQDLRNNLEFYLEKLRQVVFHTKLGSMFDKVNRMKDIVQIFPGDQNNLTRAALLSKADLVTSLVGEFPELQGVMGGYYAAYYKEHQDVIDAIIEHYKPLGKNDNIPNKPVSIAIAIADKIDSVVGLFLIGEKPTGSKDPFALRRAVFGILKIILENNLQLSIKDLLEKSIKLYENILEIKNINESLEEIQFFIFDRLKSLLLDRHIEHYIINAVLSLKTDYNICNVVKKVEAIKYCIENEKNKPLLEIYKRASQIVLLEEKKDSTSYIGTPDLKLCQLEEEQILFDTIVSNRPVIQQYINEGRYIDAIERLEYLYIPINNFFDKVIVNDSNQELRKNRLLILANIKELISNIANFTLLEG
ncbi:Glycine--tRNA ligase beta subunit [Rickettsiales bacterium Ac37b]|nr:Glycine--tRNA ligase beta subunit [Rickettsiales bacterium Ac37b]